jgi:hypothetical protein
MIRASIVIGCLRSTASITTRIKHPRSLLDSRARSLGSPSTHRTGRMPPAQGSETTGLVVAPPHGLVPDPFAEAELPQRRAIHELTRCIAIEWESEYLPLIVERLTKPMTIGFDFEYGI